MPLDCDYDGDGKQEKYTLSITNLDSFRLKAKLMCTMQRFLSDVILV